MTDEEIKICLERMTMGKTSDVINFDYAGTLEYIKRLEAENAALRNEADTNAANAIQAKLRADELEAALFTVVRNSMVMPVGLRLGKSKREIAEMTFATIEEIKKAIDYDVVKKFMEGKDE